jgi:hypothetical protein
MHILSENFRSDAHVPYSTLRFGAQLSNKLHYSTKPSVTGIKF